MQVNELIDKANATWDERNAKAVERGEEPLPKMLPLVRLKVRFSIRAVFLDGLCMQVETTGVAEMSNPVRFGQEFQGRIANPRDVLSFHRSKKVATRKGKGNANEIPEISIDEMDAPASEKLAKVRVETLVREYLATQEMQLLGENGMSDAILTFVEKDDPHAIDRFVTLVLCFVVVVKINCAVTLSRLSGS